jgi:diacylglycerol kinase family enzyme
MVQRCLHALGDERPAVAIVPAGTANLLAKNLGIPQDITQAVRIGLHGARRALDTGRINGERFAVMAGVGIDALMIRDADTGLKDRVGRVGYIVAGAKHLRDQQARMTVRVEETRWFKGKASCVLFGNVGKILGGMTVFPDSTPDDGRLEVGVVTANGLIDWGRALGRTMIGDPKGSRSGSIGRCRTNSMAESVRRPSGCGFRSSPRRSRSASRIRRPRHECREPCAGNLGALGR